MLKAETLYNNKEFYKAESIIEKYPIYFNNETYNNMEEAKAAYDEDLAAAGSKPMEEYFFGDKAKEANITNKEVALEAFSSRIELSDDEVPVARVRCEAYYIFVGVRLRNVEFPPHARV